MEFVLDAEHIIAQAREATGLEDLGVDSWRAGLERLVAALREEAGLTELGVVIAASELHVYLSNRLCITDEHRRHPERARGDIVRPIVVVGQARTGTTILYDLLARDPANRAPLSWEVDRPCPAPETATYETDPRIAETQSQMDAVEQLMPGFKAIHPIGARLAQECVRMTAADFRSLIFSTQYRVPSYGRWVVEDADMAPAYRWHRRYLQHLHAEHRGERWVLKSPAHLWCLGALLAEYPDALLVQTHRDPLRIIASVSSLQVTLRSLASDRVSLPDIAAEWSDYILSGLDRSVVAREDGTVPPDRIVDVQFGAFMAEPFKVIHEIYDRFGLELTAHAEERMRAFLSNNPSEKHGGHHYTFGDTGLDLGATRERARRYQEYFDVASEDVR